MDVRPAPPLEDEMPPAAPAATAASGGTMDVVAPAPKAAAAPVEHTSAQTATPTIADAPKPSKPAVNSSITLAIIATVVIVLGLAALATIAYLKTR